MFGNLRDLVPQFGEICPLEQVHILGREQNPSPQVFRQIAAGQKQWIRMKNISNLMFLHK